MHGFSCEIETQQCKTAFNGGEITVRNAKDDDPDVEKRRITNEETANYKLEYGWWEAGKAPFAMP